MTDQPERPTTAEPATAEPANAEPANAEPPTPAPPRPAPPSPASLAGRKPSVRPVMSAPVTDPTHSASARFGRVGADGTVYVRTGEADGAEGAERAVGSYPGSSEDEALAYFARKYDELAAAATLLEQRVAATELSAHESREALATLRAQLGEANVVGDLPALHAQVARIEAVAAAKAEAETEQRQVAKAEATTRREALVAEAETIAATEPTRVQWKQASARMRDMMSDWKGLQRSGPRLDKPVEHALWQRFRDARSSFDKSRKAWFSQLDDQHAEARRTKEKLVAAAESLSTSKDWGATAGEFKRLMQQWRQAGRAQRGDDDALWERFRSAQDAFFTAKDEVVAAENKEFEANLAVKEQLLLEAEGLLPVTRDNLGRSKGALRSVQDRWDAAGKVPRGDIKRVEGRLRAVEQAVRDVEEQKWTRTNPEVSARAQSMVEQLEHAVHGLEADLEAARSTGDEASIKEAEQALQARRTWLESARAGVAEFGG